MALVLSINMRGHDIERLQQTLNYLAHCPSQAGRIGGSKLPQLKMDGVFGPKTKARVQELQAQAGLKQDGIVGSLTGQALAVAVLGHSLQGAGY